MRRRGYPGRRGGSFSGIRIAPQHMGIVGIGGGFQVNVYRRLKVALFRPETSSSCLGAHLGRDRFYNSNEFTLAGLLEITIGCELVNCILSGYVRGNLRGFIECGESGRPGDDLGWGFRVKRTTSSRRWRGSDLSISGKSLSGRVSRWRLDIRGCALYRNSGNPVSLFVTYCLFARPFILKAQG